MIREPRTPLPRCNPPLKNLKQNSRQDRLWKVQRLDLSRDTHPTLRFVERVQFRPSARRVVGSPEIMRRYLALATDYDGRLAPDGKVRPVTVAMLKSLISSGGRLLLVTGRELPNLLQIFPEIDLFERVVAENGGWL